MSNFMRNCVIEMEIANINLSLLSMLSFVFEMGRRRSWKYDTKENFLEIKLWYSTCIIKTKIKKNFSPLL